MVVNLVCVPIIWLAYPETKGRSLEDMDDLFGKGHLAISRLSEDGDSADGRLASKAAPAAVIEPSGREA